MNNSLRFLDYSSNALRVQKNCSAIINLGVFRFFNDTHLEDEAFGWKVSPIVHVCLCKPFLLNAFKIDETVHTEESRKIRKERERNGDIPARDSGPSLDVAVKD